MHEGAYSRLFFNPQADVPQQDTSEVLVMARSIKKTFVPWSFDQTTSEDLSLISDCCDSDVDMCVVARMGFPSYAPHDVQDIGLYEPRSNLCLP